MDLSFISLHVGRSVVSSSMTDSALIIVDSTPTIYTYSLQGQYEKHSSIKGFKSYLHRYDNCVSASGDGKFLLLCDAQSNRVLFFSLEKMSLLSQIASKKSPEFCIFSHDSKYFAFANSIGTLSYYDTHSCELLGEFNLADGVSAAVFSDDLKKIAIATLDKKIHIYDINKKQKKGSFSVNDIAEALTFSKDLSTVVVYTRSGNTFILNIAMKQKLLADPCGEWPSAIAHEKNSDVSLLGTRSNQLFIYTNSNGNKLGSITLEYWGITSISIREEKVFIGFSDGNGMVFDTSERVKEAEQAIEAKNYEKLCTLAVHYPLMFVSSSLCKKIEEKYLDIFAYKGVSNEEKIGLDILIVLILSTSDKKHDILSSLYASNDVVPFMENISSGEMDKACISAYKSPILRQLREFNEIRTGCQMKLLKEIKLLESNPAKFHEYIESLPPSCNSCVYKITPNPKILEESYGQLISSSAAKNFPAVMEITNSYPILRQTKIYRRLINYGEALIDRILMMIAADRMPEAEKYAINLARLKPFASTGEDFKTQLKAYAMFESACKSDKYEQIFTLIHEYPVLRTTDKFKEQVLKHKESVLVPALAQAKLGDVTKVVSIITPYVNIEYFQDKHFELLKIGLIFEIKLYAPLTQEKDLLEKYHSCYGWDKYYDEVCKFFGVEVNETLKLDEVSQECKTLISFLSGEKILRKLPPKEEENERK